MTLDQQRPATDNERLFAEESIGYREWYDVLRDRPTDPEMAGWLALDTSYLNTMALHSCRLTNRDLVAANRGAINENW
jgi:hypothetical protein